MKRLMLRKVRMAAAIGILAMGAWLAFAQTSVPAPAASAPTAPLAFEVATVKPSDSNGTVAIRRLPGGRWIAANASLRLLITWAYDITDDWLTGAPGWVDSARFDIAAQAPSENPTRDQLHQMVQSLLADRFNLRVHWDHKELPLYRMEMDSAGPKVHALDAGTAVSQDPFNMTVLGRLSGTHVTAAMLAKVLSNQLGRFVEDDTGFDSVFDFTLVWRPEGASPEDTPTDDDRPSIFTAIREQLGFKLVSAKGPVAVISIDHVDRHPAAN
jgi:uncharacterized protein (TIGR03435 family)